MLRALSSIIPLACASSAVLFSSQAMQAQHRLFYVDEKKVWIKDFDTFKRKVNLFNQQANEEIILITDFDRTLTSYYAEGGHKGFSCHRVIESCENLPESYKKSAYDLWSHYYPIEINPNVPFNEKVQSMKDWVIQAHEIMSQTTLTFQDIVKSVEVNPINLRRGTGGLLTTYLNSGVPILIFSAGISNVVREVMRQRLGWHFIPANVNVVANEIIFSEKTGHILGFANDKEPLHVFSKHFSSLPSFMQDEYKGKKYVILMGDSLGDLYMSQGLDYTEILRIGFLNEHEEEKKEKYMNRFDVVLVGDPSMSFVQDLSNYILQKY